MDGWTMEKFPFDGMCRREAEKKLDIDLRLTMFDVRIQKEKAAPKDQTELNSLGVTLL
jgi:hypothetical protein